MKAYHTQVGLNFRTDPTSWVSFTPQYDIRPRMVIRPCNEKCCGLNVVNIEIACEEQLISPAPSEMFFGLGSSEHIILPTLRIASRMKVKFKGQFGALFDVYLGDRASIVEVLAERRS